MAHEEMNDASLTFHQDAGQIYPGWKEKPNCAGESTVQGLPLGTPIFSKDRGRSLFLSDGATEFAMTHEEISAAFLTFHQDAGQIYPGWNEKLNYTGESTVQGLPLGTPMFSKDRGRSLFLSDGAASALLCPKRDVSDFWSACPHPCHTRDVSDFWSACPHTWPSPPLMERILAAALYDSRLAGTISVVSWDVSDSSSAYPPTAFAMTHEEINAAFSTFQQDAGQIYPGWKEKLNHTAGSDRGFVGASVALAAKESSVASQALNQPSCYADPPLDEATLIRNGKHMLVDANALFDRGKVDFNTTTQAYKELLDKGGINEFIDDKPADDSIYEELLEKGGINEFINDKLATESIHEDVDKLMKVGAEICDKSMDHPLMLAQLADVGGTVPGGFNTKSRAYNEFMDKGGINKIINDKLADEPINEDVDKLMKVGMEIRDKTTDLPLMISHLLDVGVSVPGGFSATPRSCKEFLDKGGINEFINDKRVDAPIYAGADKLMRAGMEIHAKITDTPFQDLLAPGGFHTSSHACKDFLDKGGINEFINDKMADESIFVMNLDNPETASSFDQLPNEGMGLARLEVVINNATGVCPKTLLNYDTLDADTKASVNVPTRGYHGPKEFYINQLSERIPEGVKAMRAAIRAIGNGKLLSANTADDPNEMNTRGKFLDKGGTTSHAYKEFLDKGSINEFKVHILTNIDRMNEFQNGEVLVDDTTDPDWEPIMKQAGAIITNRGWCTCHAAILSRELGIPDVSCGVATGKVKTGDAVTVSGAEGNTGFTYKGELKFERTVRLSDFKRNEYQTTMGGEQYEPNEENPSIGFCGCGHYKDPFFEECFAMELEAMKMVRGDMGLKNEELMTPFVRALDMAKDANKLTEKNNLKRGEDGPQVNTMAEMPNVNVCTTDDITESVGALVYYIDPGDEEMTLAYPNLLLYRNTIDGCGLMCSFLTLAIGNNQGMRDVEYDQIYDFYMPSAFLSVLSLAFSGLMSLTFMTLHLLQFRFGDTDQLGSYYIKLTPYIINFWGISFLNLFWSNEDGTQPVRVRDVFAPEFQIFMNPLWAFSCISSVSVFMHYPENIQQDCHAPGSQLSAAIFVTDAGYLPDGTRLNGDRNATNHPEKIQPDMRTR